MDRISPWLLRIVLYENPDQDAAVIWTENPRLAKSILIDDVKDKISKWIENPKLLIISSDTNAVKQVIHIRIVTDGA